MIHISALRKREKGTGRRVALVALLGVVGALLLQAAVLAVNEPNLTASSPTNGSFNKSAGLSVVSATFDKDIADASDPVPSTIKIADSTGTELLGVPSFGPPSSAAGNPRQIILTIDPAFLPLTEAASPYTVTVNAVPFPAGDPRTVTFSFRIDNTAPAAPVISTPAEASRIASTNGVVTFTGTAEPGSTVKVLEGATLRATGVASSTGAWTAASATGAFPGTLPGAPFTVTATATDTAVDHTPGPVGNVSAASPARNFVVDSGVAAPVITSPTAGQVLNSGSFNITGTAEAGASVLVRNVTLPAGTANPTTLGTVTADGAGSWTLPVTLSPGSYTIDARQTDTAGYVSPFTSVSFSVDTLAPAVPVIRTPATGATAGSPTGCGAGTTDVQIFGTGEPGSSIFIREGGIDIGGPAIVGSDGEWSQVVCWLNGGHNITARASDGALPTPNLSADSPVRSFTASNPELVPPFVSGSTPGAGRLVGSASNVKIILSEEIQSTGGAVDVRNRVGTLVAGAITYGPDSITFTPSSALTTAASPYSVRVSAVDLLGNVKTLPAAPDFTFGIAGLPVVVSPPEGGTTGSRPTVSGTAQPGMTVDVTGAITGSDVADASGEWAVVYPALPAPGLAAGPQTINVAVSDGLGNATPSVTRNFIVDITPPAVPGITSPAANSLQAGSFGVAGIAEPRSLVRVFRTGSSTPLATANVSDTGAWSTRVRLDTSGPVELRANATDTVGNTGAFSPSRIVDVDAGSPNAVITSVDGAIITPLDTSPKLEGRATDDFSGVFGIEVNIFEPRGVDMERRQLGRQIAQAPAQCAGCPMANSVTWSFDLSFLRTGSYVAKVFAIDRAGNRTPQPAVITFTKLG